MRTIVLLGNASLAASQCWRTNVHAAAPCCRLAMQRLSRNGAFCVFTSSLIASSHVRWISASSSNSASAYRWRSCSCGVARVAVAREQPLVHSASPQAATIDVAAATSSGSTLPGSAASRSYSSAPRAWVARVVALDGERRRRAGRAACRAGRPHRRPGSPRSATTGPSSAATRAWNAGYGVVVEQAAEAAQRRARSPATRRARARRRSPRRTSAGRRRPSRPATTSFHASSTRL